MAHNLEIRNGKASFVAVGETAWHGLGTYVNQAMTSEEAIKLGGLDYVVEKKPITVAGASKIPGYWATVRKDTKDALGIVSDAYHVVQNSEAFSFFDSIIDKGEAIYQTAGVLGKGERIFVTAKLPTDILVHGEQVENYLLLTSGHDGKSAIQCGFTSIRVVCNNTLTAALKGLQNKVTILHFSNAKQKLETASKIMGMSSAYTQGLDDIFNKMATVKISDATLRQYIEEVMKPAKQVVSKEDLENQYSSIFTKKVDEIVAFAHDHSTQTTDAAKNTIWGAYNAISGYFGYIKGYSNQEEKMNDLYFKGASKRIEKAFDLATAMI